jgi:small conductance mechanosensitive channel
MKYIEKSLDVLTTFFTTYSLSIAGSIVIWILGNWMIRFFIRAVSKPIQLAIPDEALAKFLKSLMRVLAQIVVLITIANILGIETTSFVAIIGAASLAIGLALQGSLSNFAGGVLILLFKPFVINDYISCGGVEGFVKEIQIFTTVLQTGDHKTVIIPNGNLSNSVIINYSNAEVRFLTFAISLPTHIDNQVARNLALEALKENPLVLNEPNMPTVHIGTIAAVNYSVVLNTWCKAQDSDTIQADVLAALLDKLDREGITGSKNNKLAQLSQTLKEIIS